MTKQITFFTIILVTFLLLLCPATALATEGHDEHDTGTKHVDDHADKPAHHDEDVQVTLSERMQQLNNIGTAIAGAHTLVQKIELFGVIKAIPTAQHHVRAPYTGTVNQIVVQQGDSVSKGQLLAQVTNASTLKQYPIYAPAAGVVTERFFNSNELIRDEVLLRIVDFSKVHVGLSAFPNDIKQLQLGMSVTVFSLHHDQIANSNISYIAPQMTEGHIARALAVLDNQNGYWRPGMHIKALVQSAEIPVALAVKKHAVQRLDGKPVIFVREGNVFTATMPEFGREDEEYIEILSGLQPGTAYATDNSFVLKADVLKSGASHAH